MREIKFRAWDKANNRMDNDPFVNMKWYDEQKEVYFNAVFGRTDLEYVFMQYTGLKDKNGKEIYEGDINTHDDGKKGEVVFYAGGFYFRYSELEYKAIGNFAPFDRLIIGNIYENTTPTN